MDAYGYDWHQTTVGRIESAQRPLRLNEAVHLAALFEVPAEMLLSSGLDAEVDLGTLDIDTLDAQIKQARARLAAAEAAHEEIRSHQHAAREQLTSLEDQKGRAQAALYVARQDLARLTEVRQRVLVESVDTIQNWLSRAHERNVPEPPA
jgi:uncharacterized protein (DUF3084 family)